MRQMTIVDQGELVEKMTEYALDSLLGGKSSLGAIADHLVNMGMAFGYEAANAGIAAPRFNGWMAETAERLRSESRSFLLETVAGGKRSLFDGVSNIVARAALYRYESRKAEVAIAAATSFKAMAVEQLATLIRGADPKSAARYRHIVVTVPSASDLVEANNLIEKIAEERVGAVTTDMPVGDLPVYVLVATQCSKGNLSRMLTRVFDTADYEGKVVVMVDYQREGEGSILGAIQKRATNIVLEK